MTRIAAILSSITSTCRRHDIEVRRRARVVGALPDGQSALMPVAARLRHVAGTQWAHVEVPLT